MKRSLPFIAVMLLFAIANTCYASTGSSYTHEYDSFFKAAYQENPTVPKGLLEAVAQTQTHIIHIEPESRLESCVHLPKYYGVMGLVADGKNYFRNNLSYIAQLSGISLNAIKSSPATNIMAFAKAYAILKAQQSNTQKNIWHAHLQVLRALSELPDVANIQDDFAMNSHLYSVLYHLNDSKFQQEYNLPNYNLAIENLLGADNYAQVSAGQVHVENTHKQAHNFVGSPTCTSHEHPVQNMHLSSTSNTSTTPVEQLQSVCAMPNGDPSTPTGATYQYPDGSYGSWVANDASNYSSYTINPYTIAIHTLQGTYAGALSWFQNPSANVSIHYLVRSFDGQVTQMACHNTRCWHVNSENSYAVGIENEGWVEDGDAWYTETMYQSTAHICQYIADDLSINTLQTYDGPGISGTGTGIYLSHSCHKIKGHQQFTGNTHTDPGPMWNWAHFYRLINPLPNAVTYTNASGTVYDSGGASNNYANEERSTYLIQPPGATSISLNFDSYALEDGWDYLWIYDGVDDSGTLIGKYSGTTPTAVTAYSGAIFMEFRSDCATTAAGWSASYTSSTAPLPCGVPSNLSVANLHPFGATFQWNAVTDADNYELRYKRDDASTWESVYTDVNYYQLSGLEAGRVHNWQVKAICSTGFDSGYVSSVITTPEVGNTIVGVTQHTTTACTGTFTDSGGTTGQYANKESWIFTIAPTGAGTVTVDFSFFDLESGYDYLWVYDGHNTSGDFIANYTGTNSPGILTANSGAITFEFIADNATYDLGWEATWTCDNTVVTPPTTPCTGIFTDSGGAWANYGDNEYEIFTIAPTGATTVALHFTAFDIENNYDYLYIYDGADINAPLIGTYTGLNAPGTIISSGSSLTVLFDSDGATVRDGWVANWECDPSPTACTGTFTDSGGTTSTYNNHEDYTFVIAPPDATSVTLTFTNFDVETGYDYMYIYDGVDINAPLIGTYDSSSPGTITSTGPALTVRFDSDGATVADGWEATWTCTTTPSSCVPTTSIATLNDWYTSSFNATFTDDNCSSTSQYALYQVLNIQANEWRANPNTGFFNDDFNGNVVHADWTDFAGAWSANSSDGTIIQTDETANNASLYTNLTQTNNGAYVYHWRANIGGSGANRRAGMHFFSSDGNAANGNNSYFVYFRADDNKCQIYKVTGDTWTIQTDDILSVETNVWYDFKIIYNPATGWIKAYMDEVLVSEWQDTNPHTTGDYISLRVGNSQTAYDFVRVYKTRGSNELISLGDAASNAILYENPNPSTPAGRLVSLVVNNTEQWSVAASADFNVDWSPATPVSVNDGTAADIDTQTSTTTLTANWTTSSDDNSGIVAYWYAIGTSPSASDIINWTNNGLNTSMSQNALSLVEGQTYYVSVYTENGIGLNSTPNSSNGVTVSIPCEMVNGFTTTNVNDTSAEYTWTNTATATQYQIQYREIGASTWTSIMVTGNTHTITDLTPCTDYEATIQGICNSATSAVSASINFSTTNCVVGYCAASGLPMPFEYIGAVSFADINNVSGHDAGYGDYTAISSDVEQDGAYSISLTPEFSGASYDQHFSVYIDWNGDFDFDDPEELAFSSPTPSTSTVTGVITIPTNSTLGNTRMRILMSVNNPVSGPCEMYNSGEVEDYTLNIIPYDGGPAPIYCDTGGGNSNYEWIEQVSIADINNVSGNNNGYANFSNINTALEQGNTYNMSLSPGFPNGQVYSEYWQVWIDLNQDGDFGDAGELLYNTTNPTPNTINTTISLPNTAVLGNTRLRVSMQYLWGSASPTTDCGGFTYGEVEDYSVTIVPASLTPVSTCTAPTANTYYEFIESVVMGDINNNSGNNNGYANFTDMNTTVAPGSSVNITLTPGFSFSAAYNEYWRVWIDFNQDGDFDEIDEMVYTSGASQTAVSGAIAIPLSAVNGNTRMRVIMRYGGVASSPCATTIGDGEVEDYTIIVSGSAKTEMTDMPVTPTQNPETFEVKLYPNPCASSLNINCSVQEAQTLHLQISDVQGRVVVQKSIDVSKGETLIQHDVSTWPNGHYIVHLQGHAYQQSQRLIVHNR